MVAELSTWIAPGPSASSNGLQAFPGLRQGKTPQSLIRRFDLLGGATGHSKIAVGSVIRIHPTLSK